MKAKFTLALTLIMIISLAFQVTASQAAAGTYFTGTDNEDNAHTGTADGDMDVNIYNYYSQHPIEFNINIPVGGLPATDAYLTIRAYDVDEEQGQKDEVFLNGTSLGFLSGTDNTWNTTAYAIPSGLLVEGNNLVQINVDTLNPSYPQWLVKIDWGQVVVDGGVGSPGRINSITVTGYSVAGGSITLDVDVEIEALADGTFTLETNIYDPSSNNVGANSQTGIAMTAGQILTRPVQFVFPEGSNGDVYTIRGFLFDEATGLLNSIKSTTWTYSPNTAPVADDDAYSTPMNTPLNGTTVLDGDTDADGDPMTAIKVTDPSHAASFTFNSDGTFSYTPVNGYTGDDTFTYKANDGTADSNVATITITVTYVNNAPVANNETYATKMSVAFSGTTVLGNDTDVDSDPLTAALVTGPAHASAFTFNADGTFDYEPENGFQGTDTFTYVANDGTADSNVATVSVNITPLTMTFYSLNTLDGWVSESTETSGLGGDLIANGILRLGDTALNQQYRSFLSFNASTVPADAVIVDARVMIKYFDIAGVDPSTTHGPLVADVRTGFFGATKALAPEDFNAPASKVRLGIFRLSPASTIWWSMLIRSVDYHYINTGGITQFRLRFETDDDNDNILDWIRFASGNNVTATQPRMIVSYYIPHP